MAFNVPKGGEKVQREIPKKGPRLAMLTGLIDVGRQVPEYRGEKKKPRREFIPVFHLMNDKWKDDDGNEHCMVAAPFFPMGILPGSDKSKYAEFCKALDPQEEIMENGAGDMSQLLGRFCFVKIEHYKKDEIVYGNYAGVQELPEDYPVPDYTPEKGFFIFDTENPDKNVWDDLWDRTKDTIRCMVDYDKSAVKALCDAGDEGGDAAAKDAPDEDEDRPF